MARHITAPCSTRHIRSGANIVRGGNVCRLSSYVLGSLTRVLNAFVTHRNETKGGPPRQCDPPGFGRTDGTLEPAIRSGKMYNLFRLSKCVLNGKM